MSYVTLAAFKDTVFPDGTEDTIDDARLQMALDAATSAIEWMTGRTFGAVVTGATRTFRPVYFDHLDVPDLRSVTSIKIDVNNDQGYAVTLLPADYTLEPFTGPPYQTIRSTPLASYTFWPNQLCQVTGDWGYGATVPADVQQACVILANRLYNRQHTPFGVIEMPSIGNVARIAKADPDVCMLLERYDRNELWVAI